MATTVTTQIVFKVVDQFSKGVNKMSKSLGGMNKKMQKSTDASKKLGMAFTVAAGAVAAGIGLAVREFANFEQGMSSVQAITGATGEEFQELTNLAKELGRTTAFTAKEASEAMTFLGMAGFETNEIMKALPATLNLAAAGAIELGEAADIVSNIMQGFGASADETTRFADVLAKAATSSNVTILELGESMKFAAPLARQLGVSAEEATAAIGLLGNAGIKGTLAGTGLNKIMLRLATNSGGARDEVERLGVKVFDSEGNFQGLSSVIEGVANAFADMNQEQKAVSAETIAGTIGLKSLLGLVAAGPEELAKFTKELEDSAGAAQTMADIKLDNLKGSFTLLKSAISGALIELGSNFAPVLKKLAESMSDLIGRIQDAGGIIEFLKQKFDENRTTIIIIASALTAALIPAVISAIAAFAGLVIALAPFLIGGAIVGAIIAGVIAIIKNWENIKNFAISIWTAIKDFFIGIGNAIADVFKARWEQISNFFKAIWEGIVNIFKFHLAFTLGLVTLFLDKLFPTWREKLQKLIDFAITFWENLKFVFTAAMEFIKNLWQTTWTAMVTFLTPIWEGIKNVISAGWEFIKDIFLIATKPIRDAWDALWKGVEGSAMSAWENMKNGIKSAINFIIDKINFFIRQANKVARAGNVIPGVSVPQIPEIPFLAKGGIVTKPTLAVLGESGPEAVVPLGRGKGVGAGGITINITGNTLLDENAAERIGDMIIERLNMSKRLAI